MKIGNLNFEKSVFLAPMAGVTDISFRGLCKEMGCGLVYTCLLYTSPSPRDKRQSRLPSSA